MGTSKLGQPSPDRGCDQSLNTTTQYQSTYTRVFRKRSRVNVYINSREDDKQVDLYKFEVLFYFHRVGDNPFLV